MENAYMMHQLLCNYQRFEIMMMVFTINLRLSHQLIFIGFGVVLP